jgi:hypothetical protein
MTGTAHNTTPCPPAGDVQPVPVHVTGIDPGLRRPGEARKKIVTRFKTYVLTTVNPVQNILEEDFSRVCAVIIARAVIGAGINSGAYGWLAATQAQARTAAQNGGSEAATGGYISAGGQIVPVEIRGGNAFWAALDNAATANMTLTVVCDYDED